MFAILTGLAAARAAAPSDRRFLGGPAIGIAPAQAQETAATGIFHGVGVVKAIDAATGALTLDHEEIKGFMAAMEMMYRVGRPNSAPVCASATKSPSTSTPVITRSSASQSSNTRR